MRAKEGLGSPRGSTTYRCKGVVPAPTEVFEECNVFLLEAIRFKPYTFGRVVRIQCQDAACEYSSIAVKRNFCPATSCFGGVDEQDQLLRVFVSGLKAAQEEIVGGLPSETPELVFKQKWMESRFLVSMESKAKSEDRHWKRLCYLQNAITEMKQRL